MNDLPTFEDYCACLQRGGGIPVYSGTVLQRGYGIGGIFRGLANGLIPLLPKIGKIVGKTALAVAADKMSGVPFSKSLKNRGLETGKRLLSDAVKNKQKRTRKPVKRIRKTDAFGAI